MNLTQWIGIPYLPKGELPFGLDCWTLCRTFAKRELNLDLPEFMYDPERLQDDAAIRIAEETGILGRRWCRVDRHRLGDIVLFRLRGLVSHCGVAIDETTMLHTLKGRQSCLESLDNWQTRLAGIYRWNPNA